MNKVTLLQGHVLPVLQSLPNESVQCCVTSPPYWGLRNYGLEAQVWGGEAGCGHEWGDEGVVRQRGEAQGKTSTLDGRKRVEGEDTQVSVGQGSFCRLCGAWRGSYGLEPTVDCLGWASGQPCGQCYVCHTVQIFREVRRVLRKDGIMLLNLGDSYRGGKGRSNYAFQTMRDSKTMNKEHSAICSIYGEARPADLPQPGLKPKDLVGVPWRVALALQADGWWLRSDIVWAKPNPMPESCTDRPTKAHEYIFLLTKSAHYFWDAEAVREGITTYNNNNPGRGGKVKGTDGISCPDFLNSPDRYMPTSRNLRTVWEIATHPFPGSHFATFPPELVRRCVAAGTSERGCCPKCGAPWKRVVEKKASTMNIRVRDTKKGIMQHKTPGFGATESEIANYGKEEMGESTTTGWSPTCTCPNMKDEFTCIDPIPCTVLDPFSGAGTTALVAAKMGRDAIGVELNPEYVEMSRKRIAGEMGMLVEITLTSSLQTPRQKAPHASS